MLWRAERSAGADRDEVELGLRRVREPRALPGDRDVVDQRRRGRQLHGRDGGARPGVVDVSGAVEPAGDEQQPVAQVNGHADRHPTLRRIDEQLGGAALEVAAVDVAGEQVARVERRAGALRDPLGARCAGQHDLLVGVFGHGRSRRGG